MRKIVYNDDKLKEKDINRISQRAKAIIKNKAGKILLVCSNNNHHLPGGHLEKNETFDECLVRKIKEELGVVIPFEKRTPILTITYYNKDYPSVGTNSKTESKYYEVLTEVEPNLSDVKLTEDEKKGNFKVVYIDEKDILKYLEESLKECTREGVVLDTIEAIKEYLKSKER